MIFLFFFPLLYLVNVYRIQVGLEMSAILIINPSRQQTCRLPVHEGGPHQRFHLLFVLFRKDVEGGLSMISVADGNLTCYDVRQCIYEDGRARKIIVLVGYLRQVTLIRSDRGGAVKKHDRPAPVESAGKCSSCLLRPQQQL